MTVSLPKEIVNKKHLLREIAGLELCCEDETARTFKYATVEGIQIQIDNAIFKPLTAFVNEGKLVPDYITVEMAEQLYRDRIEMLANYNIAESEVGKYEFAPFFVSAHVPHPIKEGLMKVTLHQLRMIKEK